jgi:hypothetical protein
LTKIRNVRPLATSWAILARRWRASSPSCVSIPSLLLIELSPEIVALLAGIGLGPVVIAAGAVIASASTVGLLIVVENDAGFLLTSLSATLAALLSGLGLPALGITLGVVVATIGANL